MLEKNFEQLYLSFRASYYRSMVAKIGTRDGSLTATESYCVEIIYLLNRPTISAFADFLNISVPNANYKIGKLVEKGYVVKEPSQLDKREFHLLVTPKFLDYYGLKDATISKLMDAINQNFPPEEIAFLDTMIQKVLALMKEETPHD